MPTRALLIIDLQNDYFEGGLFPLVNTEAAARTAARLLSAARAAGDLVIHVRHVSEGPDGGFFLKDSHGAEIHPLVAPAPGEAVVVKNQINAFLGTDLKARLDAAGIRDLTVVGAMTHMCVDAAVRAASDFGFQVTVVADAVATRDLDFDGATVPAAQVQTAFLSALGFAYARVVPAEALLA